MKGYGQASGFNFGPDLGPLNYALRRKSTQGILLQDAELLTKSKISGYTLGLQNPATYEYQDLIQPPYEQDPRFGIPINYSQVKYINPGYLDQVKSAYAGKFKVEEIDGEICISLGNSSSMAPMHGSVDGGVHQSVFVMSAIYRDGEVANISSYVEPDGGVRLKITNVRKNIDLLDVKFQKNGANGWKLDLIDGILDQEITFEARMEEFAIAGLSAYLTLISSVSHVRRRISTQGGMQAPPGWGPGPMCINHDMKCSIGNGEGIHLWYPCAGGVDIDLLECCVKHDIKLWCAENVGDVLAANSELSLCIATNITGRILQDMGPICGFLIGWTIPLFVYPLVLILMIGLDIVGWPAKDDLGRRRIGYGDHRDSCLCGGPIRTECCDPQNSRRACTNKSGFTKNLCDGIDIQKSNPCFNCYWECTEDTNGNRTKFTVRDPNGKLPCCLQTPGERDEFPCAV